MPLYFFHLLNDLDVPDNEGTELPDLEAAIALAGDNLRFTVAETLKLHGKLSLRDRIQVEDADGNVLATVQVRDIVDIHG